MLGAATHVDATTLAGFGRCLKSKGATFYGASWCPHCRAQRQTLGDAMDYVRYVECSIDGDRKETTAACDRVDVKSYPTWIFADGSRARGEQSLEKLAEKTGCELPHTR
jgi:glutaredoxin